MTLKKKPVDDTPEPTPRPDPAPCAKRLRLRWVGTFRVMEEYRCEDDRWHYVRVVAQR